LTCCRHTAVGSKHSKHCKITEGSKKPKNGLGGKVWRKLNFSHALPSPPQSISKPHNPIKPTQTPASFAENLK